MIPGTSWKWELTDIALTERKIGKIYPMMSLQGTELMFDAEQNSQTGLTELQLMRLWCYDDIQLRF